MRPFTIQRTTQFKKDQKRIRKRGYAESKMTEIVTLLAYQEALPPKCRPHKLGGNYIGHWECHIEPDWLLIYFYEGACLNLVRTGTHADLFAK